MAHTSMKVTSDVFSHEKTAMEAQQQRQTVTASGLYNQEKHTSSSQSNITTFTSTKGIHTSSSSMLQSAASQVSSVWINIFRAKSFKPEWSYVMAAFGLALRLFLSADWLFSLELFIAHTASLLSWVVN